MKIFVVGANGRVAEELMKVLVEQGHSILAGARSVEKVPEMDGVKPVHFDLHWTVAEMAEALENSEAIYFTAGSRGKDLLQTDLYGAVKVMQAAEEKGIKRYIQLSSTFAMEPDRWNDSITNYNIAKMFSDHWLMDKTNLDYTILQPGNLEEKPATGKIEVNVKEAGPNPIPDVAATLAAVLDQPNTVKKVIMMHTGDTPIADALASI